VEENAHLRRVRLMNHAIKARNKTRMISLVNANPFARCGWTIVPSRAPVTNLSDIIGRFADLRWQAALR
jgi:hypothetical protein